MFNFIQKFFVSDQRQHQRLNGGSGDYLLVDHHRFPVQNWSPGGFRVTQYNQDLYIARQKLRVKLILSANKYHQKDLDIDLECVVLRAIKNDFAGAWIFLSPGKKHLLTRYHEQELQLLNELDVNK